MSKCNRETFSRCFHGALKRKSDLLVPALGNLKKENPFLEVKLLVKKKLSAEREKLREKQDAKKQV